MRQQILILFAAVLLANAARLPRAISPATTDFTETGNGVDPIIDLRKLSMYLLQRLPAVDTDKIIKAFSANSVDRPLSEQTRGFNEVMNLLVKGAWAQVIRRNEKESFDVKNHVFESFLLQQVSAVEADKIMNALIKLAYGTTDEERTSGFSDITNLLVNGMTAKLALKSLGRVPLTKNQPPTDEVTGRMRQYLLKRIPAIEADRIVNLFAKYSQAASLDEKREANRQLMDLLVDGSLAQIALDGVSPTQMLTTKGGKTDLATFSMQNMQLQAGLLKQMPEDEANRIVSAFMKVVTGETSDVRDQGEWEIFDMLVEGAQAVDTLQALQNEVSPKKPKSKKLATATTTDMPTYFVSIN